MNVLKIQKAMKDSSIYMVRKVLWKKAHSSYIIRDFEDDSFENRKKLVQEIADKMNAELGKESVIVNLHDQYYNMKKNH